jgi:N-methylhydantoinase B
MKRRRAIDPITLAVVQGRLEQIVEEMDTTLVRVALSPVISEGNDRANGIYGAVAGSVIAQGKSGIPILVGVMQYTVEHIIKWLGRSRPQPGDVYLVNDPYYGGTHLMDVRLA